MKFKPVYFYSAVALTVLIFLIISSQQNSKGIITNQELPVDEIHKDFTNPMSGQPGSSNVTNETIRKLDELKKAYESKPEDTLRIREYADFLTMAHRPQEAIPLYEKIFNIDSKRIDVLFSLTFIYYNEGNIDKASSITDRILSIDPNNEMAIYNSGAIEASRGNKEKAREIWTKLIQDFPGTESSDLAKNSINRL